MTGAIGLGMWIEDPGALSSGNSRLLMIFVGIVALSMLTQAIIFVVAAVAAKKAEGRLLAIAEELHKRAMPLIASAEDLFQETMPKIRTITDNLVETSDIVKAKAEQFDATLTDANDKTREQVAKVDSLISTTLARTAALADTIHDGIRMPVKQVAGVVNGFKAGLDVLLSKSKGYSSRGGHDY